MADGDADTGTEAAAVGDPAFRALLDRLSDRYNFDFREYKAASLVRRLRLRMGQVHAADFEAYGQYLDEHPEERIALFNAILINVTAFFRDREAWEMLAGDIIPRVVQDAEETRSIRVWSAGCSSGEEAYSIALLLAEHLGGRASEFQIKIYGTDVDEDALAAARQALYRVEQLKDVPDRLLQRYFARDGQLWRLRRDLRRWCIFGSHNLAQASPLAHVDLLVCRNVLIYFGSTLQDRILSLFHYAVRDAGYLFLGRSESLLPRSPLFAPVHAKWRIFQRRAASARSASVLPEGLPLAPATTARSDAVPTSVRGQRVLEALSAAVVVIDPSDTVLSWNPAAEALFQIPVENALGRKFRELDVSYRVEGLRAHVEEVKAREMGARMDDVTFSRRAGEVVHANIAISPLFESYRLIGVLVYVEDVTDRARFKEQLTRVAEQHATAIEELQSTNEELETTNEELQSTNEELETTNEELQSTNAELETTLEELQAANTELAALNAELEDRATELVRLDGYHRGVVDSIEHGLLVVDAGGVVRTWNHAAERMWGLRSDQVIGRDLFSLPLGEVIQRARPAFEQILKTGEPQRVERLPFTLPGRPEQRGLLRIAPIRDAMGEILGAVALIWPEQGSAAT